MRPRHPFCPPVPAPFAPFATLLRGVSVLLLLAALAGCAANDRLKDARAFAAMAPTLTGYAELSQRYRDTYEREQPYLSAAAEQREKAIDARRREAYPDFMAIQQAVVTYLRALGALAGDKQFDGGGEIKEFSGAIKTWPDAGITDRHVTAYANLARVVARYAGMREQDKAVQAMLREGAVPMRESLDAMSTVLRFYDKQHDNERAIVLGMLDVQIPFADTAQERLLAALAKSHRQEKASEYRLLGLRHTIAARHVADVAARHEALLGKLDPAADAVRVASPSGTEPVVEPAIEPAASAQQGAQP